MIYPKLRFDVDKCHPEWTTFGTFCDYESLKRMVLSDQSNIMSETSQTVSIVQKLETQLQLLAATYQRVKKNPHVYESIDGSTRSKFDALLSIQPLGKTPVKQKFEECWREMARLRSSSVCQICSGRSKSFFKNGNPSIVSSETCFTTMNICRDSILLLGRTSEISKQFKAMLDTMRSSVLFKKIFIEGGRLVDLDVLTNVFCSKESPLTTCSKIASSTQVYQEKMNWFCSRFLKLQGKTLISEMNPKLVNLAEVIEFIRSVLQVALKEIASPILLRRYTHITGNGELGKIELKPFKSEAVAVQASSESSISAKVMRLPLNLTLSFP